MSVKHELINLFGSLPYTFLWKFDEEFERMPKNVHVRKWMPQNSILAHPNTKVFISHCGLLSTLESLYFSVPVLAALVFGDQHRNAADAVKSGRALRVDLKNVILVQAALKEIAENKTHFVRTNYLSTLCRARPVSPSRLVSFYVELAIETKGAFHLRSKALLHSWYEIQNILLMVYFSCRTTDKLLCRCCRRKRIVVRRK